MSRRRKRLERIYWNRVNRAWRLTTKGRAWHMDRKQRALEERLTYLLQLGAIL